MERKAFYVKPTADIYAVEIESLICSSLGYGDEGNAGDNHFSNDDIENGWDF
ncbi:MAG: hypothetical protein J6U80_00025 [Bacteroidales bacterium]|nr:hypothetical protein [Bacteroidales bacterium]